MVDLFVVTPQGILLSVLTCVVLREIAIIALPGRLAGPGGRWIDTRRKA